MGSATSVVFLPCQVDGTRLCQNGVMLTDKPDEVSNMVEKDHRARREKIQTANNAQVNASTNAFDVPVMVLESKVANDKNASLVLVDHIGPRQQTKYDDAVFLYSIDVLELDADKPLRFEEHLKKDLRYLMNLNAVRR